MEDPQSTIQDMGNHLNNHMDVKVFTKGETMPLPPPPPIWLPEPPKD